MTTSGTLSYLCKLDSSRPVHLVKDLRVLPCSGIACLDCIRKSLDFFRVLECPFCKQNHVIADLEKDLQQGSYRELEMKRLLPGIFLELSSSLKKEASQISGTLFSFYSMTLSPTVM